MRKRAPARGRIRAQDPHGDVDMTGKLALLATLLPVAGFGMSVGFC